MATYKLGMVKLGVCVAAAAAGLAACGSSSGSSAGVPSGANTPIALLVDGTQTPATTLGGLAFPFGATGAQAAAASINAAGGINGRKIRIDVCDNKGDPNVSAACGRLAKSNGDIAVVGSFDLAGGSQIVSTLQAESIPFIGGLPGLPVQFSSPISFQFDPGPLLANFAGLWADIKCTRVVAFVPANPGNDQVLRQQVTQGEKRGLFVDGVLVPSGIADVTPTLSAAIATRPDCMTLESDGPNTVKMLLGAKKLGYTGRFVTSTASLSQDFLKVLGSQADGVIALDSTLLPSSGDLMVTQFRNDLNRYLHGNATQVSENLNEFAQDGWSSVQLVKQALTGSGTASAGYLLKKIPTMCDVNVGNVYPHINFCKPVSPSKELPHVYNDFWQYYQVKSNAYVSSDNVWHDLSSTIP